MPLSPSNTTGFFFYITDVDLSGDDGPGANEWGFVSSLTHLYPGGFLCFAPSPARPEGRLCPGVQYVQGHRGLSPLSYLVFQLDLLRTLIGAARQRRPDGIVMRPGLFPLAQLLAVTWLNVPLFVKMTGMGVFTVLSERHFPLGKYILHPLASWMQNKLLRRAQLVEAASKTAANWAVEMFGLPQERLVVIPNGVDTGTFYPRPREQAREHTGLSSRSRVVGFVGSLNNSYTGLDLLLEASPTIVQRCPETTFVIVGDGKERPKLEKQAQHLNLQKHVLFQGHVAHEDVPNYISAFDVAVILWPSERMRAFGSSAIKLGEYLACGCTVVASQGDGHEFIEENGLGWLVVPEESEEVAEMICAALSLTEAEKTDMGERAVAFVDANLSTVSLAQRRYELWTGAIQAGGSRQR